MEDLTLKWNKLSLSQKEGKHVVLSKNKLVQEFVLAAKFLTRRNINIDAVAKTFGPPWHTNQSFNIRDAGDNYLLFSFEVESDLEKVFVGEPWSYDRHLVVFQRYDGKTPMTELEFAKSLFWVKIHNLPFHLLSPEIALDIGVTLGEVVRMEDTSEMVGGNLLMMGGLKDGSLLSMKGSLIFAIGVEGSLMMIRIALYG